MKFWAKIAKPGNIRARTVAGALMVSLVMVATSVPAPAQPAAQPAAQLTAQVPANGVAAAQPATNSKAPAQTATSGAAAQPANGTAAAQQAASGATTSQPPANCWAVAQPPASGAATTQPAANGAAAAQPAASGATNGTTAAQPPAGSTVSGPATGQPAASGATTAQPATNNAPQDAGKKAPDAAAAKPAEPSPDYQKFAADALKGDAQALACVQQLADKGDHKAATGGDAEAQYHISNLYRNGWGVPHDYNEAMKWGLKSAQQGNDPAARAVSLYYEFGSGVKQDPVEAYFWGSQLGVDARLRQGLDPDQAAAADRRLLDLWTKIANDNTAPRGLQPLLISEMYRQGFGVQQEWEQTYFWYTLGGCSSSCARNEEIAIHLTKARMFEINNYAKTWKPGMPAWTPGMKSARPEAPTPAVSGQLGNATTQTTHTPVHLQPVDPCAQYQEINPAFYKNCEIRMNPPHH
jgi:TPR repeat protein